MNNKDNRYKAACYLVSFGFDDGGAVKVAIVGQRNKKGGTDVVNVFSGDEAAALHEKLIIKNAKG